MFFNLAEQPDSAAEQPVKFAELKTLFAVWSAELDAERRKLGIEPKSSNPPSPAEATSVRR